MTDQPNPLVELTEELLDLEYEEADPENSDEHRDEMAAFVSECRLKLFNAALEENTNKNPFFVVIAGRYYLVDPIDDIHGAAVWPFADLRTFGGRIPSCHPDR